jgi:AcrR family transcriptional regulator
VAQRGRHSSAWKNVAPSRDQLFKLKRNALLREAAKAFSARGYHDTSLDEVAKALGVTKPALYYYVKNKQEILFECHMLSQDLGEVALAYGLEHGETGRERIVNVCRRYIELITGELGSFAVLSEYSALEPANRETIGKRRDHFQNEFSKIVAGGKADGSIRNVDPRMTAFFFMGAINWMTQWFRPDGSLSGKEIAHHFADLMDHALTLPHPGRPNAPSHSPV